MFVLACLLLDVRRPKPASVCLPPSVCRSISFSIICLLAVSQALALALSVCLSIFLFLSLPPVPFSLFFISHPLSVYLPLFLALGLSFPLFVCFSLSFSSFLSI